MDAQIPGRSFTLRCSTVFVTEGDEMVIYRSIDAIPGDIREKLEEKSRAGTATIFIANQGGRDELAKRLRGLPSRVQTRLEEKTSDFSSVQENIEGPSFTPIEDQSGAPNIVRNVLMMTMGLALLIWLIASWQSI